MEFLRSQNRRHQKSSPTLRLLGLAFTLAFWAGIAFSQEPLVSAESQEKVAKLLQTVIQDHWNGGGPKGAAGTNASGNYTNIEAAFREASKLMPYRLDLRFGIASSLMSQAIQTNGPQLELKVKDALRVYQEIQALDTNGFEAPVLYAAYARAIGETNASEAALKGLMAIHRQRTGQYLRNLPWWMAFWKQRRTKNLE